MNERSGSPWRTDSPSRFARRAVPVAEARERLLQCVRSLAPETVSTEEALGRRLAEPFCAAMDMPHFRRSGMDGFAVRSADVREASPQAPVKLRVVGESVAGCTAPPRVEPGTAVRIMTGALVPEGADAVIMFEQTDELVRESARDGRKSESAEGFVHIRQPAKPGQNVSQPGEDFRAGERLFAVGDAIGPGHLAVFASFGVRAVSVYRRPVVGLLGTGNEFVTDDGPFVDENRSHAPGDSPGDSRTLPPGQIRNSNIPMLAAQVTRGGGIPRELGLAGDDPLEIARMLREGFADCDIIVTSGGVSVGDHDAVAMVLREMKNGNTNSDVLFDRVAMRPGAPTSAALLDGKPLVALSGNPGACFVGFELFVRPLLAKMQGAHQTFPVLQATLDQDYAKGSPFDRYERAWLYVRDGALYVRPCGFSKSSMMRTLPQANALMIIPAGNKGASLGEKVEVIPLESGMFSL